MAEPADIPAQTLAELFAWRVAQTPDAPAYRQYDPESTAWRSLTWADAAGQVERVRRALQAMDLPLGARIAILLPNGLDAVGVDQAALAMACVPVPMHALDNPASIAYILADSEAALLVAASSAQWEAIAAVGMPLPALRHVVVLDHMASSTAADPPVAGMAAWLSQAVGLEAPPARWPLPEDLAALVYTSGTTGKPKGVMLTHRNVLENVKATLQRVAPAPGDIFLSFLPLSHTFERTAGYYLPVAAGCCVAFARSVGQLSEDLQTVRPTILISVPRIYERVHAKLQSILAGSPARRRLFTWACSVGWRRFCRMQGLPVQARMPALLDELAWPLLELLVARPLLAQFGGRLRVAVSGGAPLSQSIAHCFLGLGLPIVQGYGMTETSPVVAANAPEDNDPATVGRALAGVELRIGPNQELLVRGPGVMRGYWKRTQETADSFADGWLRTGDQAAIENGRLRILGRVKEIIVTSTGEKIAPADLELAIMADPLFEQVFAFGDNRPFIACIVVLGQAGWLQMAASLRLDPADPASLEALAARDAALARIRTLTTSFPHHAQPRAVGLTLAPWTPENSLMTPTLKLKRKNLATHFAVLLDSLYRR